MLPRSLVAAEVPVPEVVPPALSTVKLIELSTVPVTVSVPLEVSAEARVLAVKSPNTATNIRNDFVCVTIVSSM
jgi:hypothetical protein